MMRRFVTVLLGLLGVLALAPRAEAQEIQLTGPLAGAPAARKLRLYRQNRFEIAPTVSFTLLDEYRRTILVGGKLTYNLSDWLGIGVWGAFGAVKSPTDLTEQINSVAVRGARTAINMNHTTTFGKASFDDQVSSMEWVAAPQVTFVPFRGKLAIFQKVFVDADAYLHGGVAFVGLKERGDCGGSGQKGCANPVTFDLVSRMAIAPTFGLGLTFYIGNFVSLGVEYRALPFAWNRAGFDTRGAGTNGKFPDSKINSDDQTFKFNQMVTIALGFSLPSKPKISD